MLETISLLPPETERPRSVNNFWACIWDNQTAMQRHWPIIILSTAFTGRNAGDDIATTSSLYVLVFNLTNLHAMSHGSDYVLASSSNVNIEETAFYLTIRHLLTVIQVELPRVQFPTAMSDTKSLNTSMLEVMISSNNQHVFIRDFSDRTSQTILHAWWVSMNVDSKRPITWDDSGHAPSQRFYLHCGIEETSSLGIICIVSLRVLRHPSEHWTSSMGKHQQAKALVAKLNELTVSEVTEMTSPMADERAYAILKRQGSLGITMVSLQR